MQLSGYSEITELAQGGMAKVYKARQLSLNRTVAIKFLSVEFLWDDEAKNLFEQESLVIAQINHPNIIHIIDRGLTEKGRPYFVMEYIQGHELTEIMKKRELPIKEKINLILQICKGLECAHKNGIIHRDIKPANILIDTAGHARILDFGIAWFAASGQPENIVGTPDYMSPEQFTAPESVSFLSDIYSLGVLMYELFMHKLPAAYLNKPSLGIQGLPTPLAELIEQCLKTNPEDRPQSAEEIRLHLLQILQGAHLDQAQKDEADEVIADIRNKFSLLDIIKRDRYGAVYLFEDKSTKNLLVIKKRINTDAGYREAKILGQIYHQNIIKILGTSKNNNIYIAVMEHVAGGSLQDRLIRPYSTAKFIPYARQICSALQHAHKYKIEHGNLRPSNILFDDEDKIKITDFGLDEHYIKNNEQFDWYQPKTQTASVKKRDIYSAGVIFHQMLTGLKPEFNNERLQPTPEFNKLDERLQKILQKMLNQDENNHYYSFKEIISDLNKIQAEPIQKQIKDKIEIEIKETFKLKKIIMLVILIELFMLILFFYYYPHYFTLERNTFSSWISWFSQLF